MRADNNNFKDEAMPKLYFARPNDAVEALVGTNPEAVNAFCRRNATPPRGPLLPSTPYCLDDDVCARTAVRQLLGRPAQERQRLICCAEQFGELTTALAEFYDQNLAFLDLQNTAGLVGAGATARGAYNSRFIKALRRYQGALIELNEFERRGSGSGLERQRLQQVATQRYQTLNQEFQFELKKFVPAADAGKNRGSALTSAERGITLASRPRGRGINVTSLPQAQKLVSFGKSISHVGNGLIVLDAGIRLNKAHQAYQDKENWAREASVQAAGFGAGGAAGLAAGKATVATLVGLGLASTPAGWILIMGLGVGVGFGAGYAFDKLGQWFAGTLWDR